MSEFLEIPQFVVSPPDFEVIQQSLALINSQEELLPQIAGMDPLAQAELLDEWYAIHYPDEYMAYNDLENNFFAATEEELKQFRQIVNEYTDDAANAAKEWVTNGGTVSGTGAATVGGKISYDYAASLATSSSSTTAMSVLSMNLPTAAAAMAPLIGFALGWTLYEASPEFWTSVSKALLPFCYEDTELMPVMADDKGNTYFPKDAIDSLKAVFDSSASLVAGAEHGLWMSNYTQPVPGEYPITKYSVDKDIIISSIGSNNVPYTHNFSVTRGGESGVYVSMTKGGLLVFSSLSWFKMADNGQEYDYTYTVTGPNKTKVYYAYVNLSNIITWSGISPFDPTSIVGYSADAEHNAVNNVIGTGMGVNIDGVTKWNGVSYPSDIEAINILGKVNEDKSDYKKIQYIPIATPYGRPGESIQSTVLDLTTNQNPNEAISPWISKSPDSSTYPEGVQESPKPAPLPSILPNPTIVANPEENPSTKPETKPQPALNTQTPTDTGTSEVIQNPNSIPFLPGDGIVHVYNPTSSELKAFGSWLWRTFSGDIIETVSKLFNSPMDALIGLHELYATPNIAGTDNIKCGYLTSDIASKYVGNRYSTINCGSIVVPEFYNNYLDYSPYTKCFIYLPFIGIVPVHADDIIGNGVNITYNIDSYTGSCIAAVTVAREGYSSMAYQFQGNCAAELPITSGYHSSLMSGLLAVAGTAISGNPHVGLSAANLGRASLGKNEVSHSGSFGATYGAMGAKKPYIIVKRPTQRSVVNYNEDYGFPAHKRITIGACTGYLRAREVHVISSTATNDEKARIEELLKEGVFVE